MEETEQQHPPAIDWRAFWTLLQRSNPPKWLIGFALLISLVETAAGLVVPFVTKNLVDGLSQLSWSSPILPLLIGAFIVQALASGLSLYMLSYVGQTVVANMRTQLWKKVLRLPITYFDHTRTGDTMSRIVNDTGVIKDLIANHLISFFSSIVSIIGAIGILFYLDWQMTLVLLLVIPIVSLIIRPMGKKMYTVSKNLQDETATFSSLLTQVLAEIRLVKLSGAEAVEAGSGQKRIATLFAYSMKEAKIHAILAPLMTLVLMGVLVLVVGYGGVRVSTGALTAGELVAFLLYLFQIILPFSSLARFFTSMQKAMGATERVIALLQHEEEDTQDKRRVENPRQPIRIEHVSFGYRQGERVLHDVSFTVEPGSMTAIVGPSGSGKTTLFALLERFYEPTSGAIYLGEERIDDYTLASWRDQIGYVSQESPLIAGTVRENICYGMERDVEQEEMEHAARQAFAADFIQELPDGYDTDIGERGIKLSGGQRQRLAIARAILRNPNILMLDEATSNLDSASEMAVQQALNQLMQGRTTLVIAHRLSTVRHADRIIVLEQGRVTGSGTHEQLLTEHERYRELAAYAFSTHEQQGRE
ncbi:ABC transporter ATP-binding protein [Aneurinibacillus sp. REN35]|uniref:ABC transporter ATP-binding protein n=1 Tax=Aneurinibacillus sp. REN35 TaxID=3237286 RepID=UPI003527912C